MNRCDSGYVRKGADDGGSALLPVMLLMFLFSAIAVAMVAVVRVETTVAGRSVQSAQALYAADAAVAVAISEMRALNDWTPVLSGAAQSALSDGAFAGRKNVPGGGSVLVCCGASSIGGRLGQESAASAAVARRALPWRPYLWSSFAALLPRSPPSRVYLVVFVQDDDDGEDEDDGDGSADVNGRVVVRAEAVQPDGLRRSVEALIAREPGDPLRGLAPAVRLLRWREAR